MAIKSNRRRIVAAAIAIAGVTGGAVGAHAATFEFRVLNPSAAPATFPAITPTCTSSCNISLLAGTGTVTVQDAVNGVQSVPFFGFGVNGAAVALAGSPNSTIKVPQGTTLTITLTQSGITDPIDLSFPSLPRSDVSHSPGNVYTVVANKIGTSVFQPGTNNDAPKQVAMGLVGVLIVTPPSSVCASPTLSCAYDGTSYNDEALVATTDLDYEFATSPTTFDMGYFGQPASPAGTPRKVYHVINGKSFPDTDVIDVRAGDSLLLRSVNAGVSDKSMDLLGLRQSLLARNASKYTDPQMLIAPLVGPGETADLAVQIPAGASGQRLAFIDQSRQMNHGNAYGFGGATTFVFVWPAAQQVAAPPTVTAAYDVATQTLSGTATPSFAAYPVTKVEYSLDNTTFVTLLTNPLGITTFGTTGDLPLSPPQTIYVRVTDTNNLVGTTTVVVPAAAPPTVIAAYDLATHTLSGTATPSFPPYPVTLVEYSTDNSITWNPLLSNLAGITAFGTPGNVAPLSAPFTIDVRVTDTLTHVGSTSVIVTAAAPTVTAATASALTGEIAATATPTAGLTVTAAEYFIGPTDPGQGSATILSFSGGPGTYSLNATDILSLGDQVSIRAQDSFGQWSSIATVTVTTP